MTSASSLTSSSSGHDIQKQSHIEVADPRLYNYDPERVAAVHGALDKRLGNIGKTDNCVTCGRNLRSCNGHWGYIRLSAPCFHVGFLGFTIQILSQVCKASTDGNLIARDLLTMTELFALTVERRVRQKISKGNQQARPRRLSKETTSEEDST